MKETNRQIPDPRSVRQPLGLSVSEKHPEQGPRLIFFSGGTALRELSRAIPGHTHNSVHIMTPFDSGGSSAELRKAFHMPAIGDIRNRMMALVDLQQPGIPEVFDLFSYRLPKKATSRKLHDEIVRIAGGNHLLAARIHHPIGRIISRHLTCFLDFMPQDFDLRGASIGNLVLAAGYLSGNRSFEPVLSFFSRLMHVRGLVRPVVNADLQLAAVLENGTTIIGQDRITGKECPPIEDRINRVFLTEGTTGPAKPVEMAIDRETHRLIGQAELICYPMGSFYSSLIANLLPGGIAAAISKADCPKVFIPNTGTDPEARGLDTADQVEILLKYLSGSTSGRLQTGQVLHTVVLDEAADVSGEEAERIRGAGVQVMRCPLVSRNSAPYLDGAKLANLLVGLASGKTSRTGVPRFGSS